jgi:hypothetical protein
MIDRELAAGEVLIEGKIATETVGVHVVMRQNLVPRTTFDAEFEIPVPDAERDALTEQAKLACDCKNAGVE